MEPISLGVLLRSIILLYEREESTLQDLEKKLRITTERAKAIERQLQNMLLIEKIGEKIKCTLKGSQLVVAFREESWDEIHEILIDSCKEYRTLLKALQKSCIGQKGLMTHQIISISQNLEKSLNRVTVEICCDWGCRLGKIQKNLYTSGVISRFYLVSNNNTSSIEIERAIVREYISMRGNNLISLLYVSIPKIREIICELEKISRSLFDKSLLKMWIGSNGSIELASGPLNSSAIRTPTHILSINVDRNNAILSPKYALRVGEGLDIGGKKYQTIAFHQGF